MLDKSNHKAMAIGKWVGLFGLCIASAVFLRAANATPKEPVPRGDKDGLDYFCIAEVAVALHQGASGQLLNEEMKLEVSPIAERRCRPALLPEISESKTLASAMDFDTGYGGMLGKYSGTRQEAIAAAEAAFTAVGWVETAASVRIRSIKKDSTFRAFERDGGWILAVAVEGKSKDGKKNNGSALLVAGQWRRDILERL